MAAIGTPADLLAGLGGELLELRVDDVARALAVLDAGDANVVGQTLTLPLRDTSAGDAVAALDRAGLTASAISTRRPTLDDVYLRLTGESFAAAA